MNESSPIEGEIINVAGFATLLISIMLAGTVFSVLLVLRLDNPIIGVMGILLSWLVPGLVFVKQLRKPFIKKVVVRPLSDRCSIEVYDRSSGELGRTDENLYCEVSSFRALNSSKDDSSSLRFQFKSGYSVAYTFLGQNDAQGRGNIVDEVVRSVHSYNDAREATDMIGMSPSFFASRVGTYFIAGLTILLIVAIVLQAVFKPVTIPITMFSGIFLYLQIIAQRKKDVEGMKQFEKK